MSKVLCFGELLLRMSPQLNGEWIERNAMPVFIGGAELNVATALAKWDVPVGYCTALPDHYLSKEVIDFVSGKGIDTNRIQHRGARIGTYYLPQGADLKNAGVIYDRAYSSFWELKPGELDWDRILDGVSWFNFSAISPALNEDVAAVCKEGAKAASEKGITVSIDLNYRAKLWQYGKQPREIMPGLVEHCNVVMGNIWSAETLLGLQPTIAESKGKTKQELMDAAGQSMKQIHLAYPNVTTMAYTFRLPETYFGLMQHGSSRVISQEHELKNIVDSVGSGDCFMGGLIYGLFNRFPAQEVIDFAAAAAYTKLFIKGDATTATVGDVKKAIHQHA